MIGIYSPGIWRIPHRRNFWRNRARNFLCCALFRKRRCYRRVGTSSQRGETSRHRKAAGKPVIRLEDGFVRSLDLASMASRRFLWWWMIVAFTTCQQAFSTGETGKG